jgi:hypothetical protein
LRSARGAGVELVELFELFELSVDELFEFTELSVDVLDGAVVAAVGAVLELEVEESAGIAVVELVPVLSVPSALRLL